MLGWGVFFTVILNHGRRSGRIVFPSTFSENFRSGGVVFVFFDDGSIEKAHLRESSSSSTLTQHHHLPLSCGLCDV